MIPPWAGIVLFLGGGALGYLAGRLAAASRRHAEPTPTWVHTLKRHLVELDDRYSLVIRCRGCEHPVVYDSNTGWKHWEAGSWQHVAVGHVATPYLRVAMPAADVGPL